MEGQQSAAVPTEAELEKSARALLAAGRAALPIKIDGIPLKAGSPKRHFTHIEVSDTNFVRMWLASLLHRTLDAYESTLLLWETRLDLDARAHIRIGFEHLCAFAWVATDPTDTDRPLRIARHGLEFYERQMSEMSKHRELSGHHLRELGFAIHVNQTDLRKPPSARDLCAELDRDWRGRLTEIQPDGPTSFSAWYSYLFRGASAFVHPTSVGMEPLLARAPGAFVIEPSRKGERRVLELCALQLSIAIAVASLSDPGLIDVRQLDGDSRKTTPGTG